MNKNKRRNKKASKQQGTVVKRQNKLHPEPKEEKGLDWSQQLRNCGTGIRDFAIGAFLLSFLILLFWLYFTSTIDHNTLLEILKDVAVNVVQP